MTPSLADDGIYGSHEQSIYRKHTVARLLVYIPRKVTSSRERGPTTTDTAVSIAKFKMSMQNRCVCPCAFNLCAVWKDMEEWKGSSRMEEWQDGRMEVRV